MVRIDILGVIEKNVVIRVGEFLYILGVYIWKGIVVILNKKFIVINRIFIKILLDWVLNKVILYLVKILVNFLKLVILVNL